MSVNVCPYNAKFTAGIVILTTVVIALIGGSTEAKTWRVANAKHSSAIHMRQLPASKSNIVGYIPFNATNLSGGPCRGNWCRVEYGGKKGWVYKKYLAPQSKEYSFAPLTAAKGKSQQDKSDSLSFPTPPKGQDIPLISNRNGPPIPVYAFPSDQLPISGRLPSATATVKSMGACVRNWCYIRSGTLAGWIPRRYFATASENGSNQNAAASSQKNDPEKETKFETPALNNTEHTATQIAQPHSIVPQEVESGATKLYSLAGLPSGRPLVIREQPNDGGSVLGSVPHSAKDVEGMHKCVNKWCLVRYHKLTGWVLRRHLADDSLEKTQSYLVKGIGLMDKLEVADSPSKSGDAVGHIPAYATGIVPIGRCDDSWCHVRYLGLAGWVRSQYLTPAKR